VWETMIDSHSVFPKIPAAVSQFAGSTSYGKTSKWQMAGVDGRQD